MSEKKLISIKEAALLSPYQQGYLSLLARRGELQAEKVGRNWFTTVDWLNDYIEEKKPDRIIETDEDGGSFWKKIYLKKETFWLGFLLLLLFSLAGYWFWENEQKNLSSVENTQEQGMFISEEIIKIPNEDGGYDIYEAGRRRISN